MEYNSKIHHRKSIRLNGYDYSQDGVYFITIITQNKKCIFGDIINNEMRLNDIGQIVKKYWLEISNYFPNITLDEYIIMPNHIHGIIIVDYCRGDPCGRPGRGQAVPLQNRSSIGDIIGAYKSLVANACLNIYKSKNKIMEKLWQRNYYEHIIRNEKSLNKIRKYIFNNSLKWEFDENNLLKFYLK